MNHNRHTTHHEASKQKPLCVCGKECLCCIAEKLSVSCGCDMETKQYEYKVDEKVGHSEHVHKESVEKREKMVYICPMHPEVVKDEPGLCPGCGMVLVPSVAKAMEGKPKKADRGVRRD